jgi:hypothetical protein
MAHRDETIELDVLPRSCSSLEEDSGISNSIRYNGTKDLHQLFYRPSKNSNMEQRFISLTALKILRETFSFFFLLLSLELPGVSALFICPVPEIFLSNAFIDQLWLTTVS